MVNGSTQTTVCEYDKNGNLKSATDWMGRTVKSEYDPLGRVTKRIDPANVTVETLKYDANGDQISSKDALGKETTFT